ncbi:MAG: alanine--tRNA ligase [Bacillaceae bacterium]|nr:alanine--tRNA ligase [Bacillaceae bacterium]
MSSSEIRQKFLDFFESKGHHIEPSAPLVPHDDPSLLWINAGMAPLKKYFDGRVVPDNPRIANSQKCIRTNDIENVGKTARHHTFFEMLGNFSIGDYFKKEAIHWAWEFLTDPNWIGFDPDKLSVTVYPEDEEAFNIWNQEIGLPKERIIKLEDNFWDIGEGPCGPCSEIFYDRGEAFGNDPNDPELYPGGENERYLEIWNLVFSQFNHNADGSYTPLPKKNIDTGMGLERMASVLQDVPNNFETDLFFPIIQTTAEMAGVKYGEKDEFDVALKVIADHVRTVTFAVGDGALPSNEGRGYVIRRLLRRAVRYGKVLGIHEPFMYKLTAVVGEIMGSHYPEVVDKRDFIEKIIKTEEERFHETLNEGLSILQDILDTMKKEGRTQISGQEAFKLYDTYGFPLDLTEDFAGEHGFSVDHEGFEAAMAEQRERARAARQDEGSMQVQGGALNELNVDSEFVGYDQLAASARVEAIIYEDQFVDFIGESKKAQVVLDRTPFYAESGGQVADKGLITGNNGTLKVEDVQKAPGGQHVHTVLVERGTIRVGDEVEAQVDAASRTDIIKNHSATHLLHQALKDVLGDHVNQAGSLVAPDRLRFDFSHFGPVTEEELQKIEDIVNEQIWRNAEVEKMYKPLEEAKAMGAMALFGEKYGEIVRVVRIGDYSLELCGGCHVNHTAEIGLFKIVSESGIGAGTRRIEALTGRMAYQYLNEQLDILRRVAADLKVKLPDVPGRIDALKQQVRDLERENESLRDKISHMEAKDLESQFEEINGIRVLSANLPGVTMENLRNIADDLKQKVKSGIVVLGTSTGDKVNLIAVVTPDLVEKGYHAGKLIKEVASRCGGGGGGRPDMAQAGGKQPEKLNEALDYVKDWVKAQ